MTGRRLSIRKRIRTIVLVMVTASLLTTSLTGLLSMFKIRDDAREVLVSRMEDNLVYTITNKAEIAHAEFGRYTGYINMFAEYIHGLYLHPSHYASNEIKPPDKYDKTLSMKRYIASKDIPYSDLEAECGLLGNVSQVFTPIVRENSEIVAAYLSTVSGLQISCDRDSSLTGYGNREEVYFNYFSRPWYTMIEENPTVYFTNVYSDTYGRGYMITCAAPFYDAHDQFAGVVCIDMLTDHLFDVLVDFDLYEGDGDYAFLIDGNGYAVNPKYHSMNIYADGSIDEELKTKIMTGETGVSYSQNGSYYAYAPINDVNWKLCIKVPKNLILQPVEDMNVSIQSSVVVYIIIFILAFVLMYVLVRRFADSVTKPLFALRQDAEQISSGNLDHVAHIYNNDEIGDLAVSFNSMALSLKDYIENLTRVTAEKERLGAELDVAAKIQADMLPRNFPPFPDKKEFELYALMDPAKEVGGDFYDFFLLDDDHICLVMADVSGKGVPAALFMVIAKTLIKKRAQLGGTPAEILEYVNEQLMEGNDEELFVTVWLAIIEISTGRGIAANAGHEHPALMRAGEEYELKKYPHSLAVACMEGIRFREHEFKLNPGDKLFVYTDGVPEAINEKEEMFGEERILKVLNENKESSVEDVLHSMRQAIEDYDGDMPQFDDITMMSFYYYGRQA